MFKIERGAEICQLLKINIAVGQTVKLWRLSFLLFAKFTFFINFNKQQENCLENFKMKIATCIAPVNIAVIKYCKYHNKSFDSDYFKLCLIFQIVYLFIFNKMSIWIWFDYIYSQGANEMKS